MSHAEKNCIDCKKTFMPTGNTQKRCEPCGEIYKVTYRKEHKKVESAAKTIDPALIKKSFSEKVSNDSRVIQMLIAVGLVTEEKVQAAREIVRKLLT